MSTESTDLQITGLKRDLHAIDLRLQSVESDVKILRATCATKEELQRGMFEMQRAVTEMQRSATEMQRSATEMAKAGSAMHEALASQTWKIVGVLTTAIALAFAAIRFLPPAAH